MLKKAVKRVKGQKISSNSIFFHPTSKIYTGFKIVFPDDNILVDELNGKRVKITFEVLEG